MDGGAWEGIGGKMRSFTLETIRLLNIWSDYIFGKLVKPKDDTPNTSIRHKQKLPRLIRLPAYKGDADEQYNLGRLFHDSQCSQMAYHWFRIAAKQGHAKAQYLTGCYYATGFRVEKDYPEAVKWYRRSAEQGFAVGQRSYAEMLLLGRGIEVNNEEAIKWHKLAAKQGVALSQYFLGAVYFYGAWPSTAKQNFQEAVKWLRLVANQGYSGAQFHLGKIYHKGGIVESGQQSEFEWRKISDKDRIAEKQLDLWLGDNTKDEVAQDFDEAIRWYQLSAEQDNPNAQFNLGLMYIKGHGVSQDHEKGIEWIERASEHDHPDALYYLGRAYDLGDGVEPDDDYSNLNYEIAAEYGHSGARFGMTGDGSQNHRGN